MDYKIMSKSGDDYGIFSGQTPAHALAQLHRQMGWPDCRVADGDIADLDEDNAGSTYRQMYGGVDDWDIEGA